MKKIIICILTVFAVSSLYAQTVNVHFKNGQTIQFNSSNVDYVDFSEKAPDPTVTAGAAVDLGLSVYWSSCNLGAETPEEYGYYYAWGETNPKSKYTKENYSYYDNNTKQYIDIGNNISGTDYDAAKVNLGNDWRMPTKSEIEELLKQCTWEWTQINGINGYKVIGANNNSIFLPAAGSAYYYSKNEKMLYYTGIKSQSSETAAYGLLCTPSERSVFEILNLFDGATIRPVTTNPNAGGNNIDHSKDYLVTDKISASFIGGAYSSINGRISNGSQLSWKFSNNSSESVNLTGIQLIDGVSGDEGGNLLNEQVGVPANESKSYTITVGIGGINKPKVKFSYLYNKKKYSVEASMPD